MSTLKEKKSRLSNAVRGLNQTQIAELKSFMKFSFQPTHLLPSIRWEKDEAVIDRGLRFVLNMAREKARRGSNLIIEAYQFQGNEAVRDALSALAEALPDDLYGGYAD